MYAELALVAAAVLLLAWRLLRGRSKADGPTYPDPELKLDKGPGPTHDLFGELDSTLSADHDDEMRYLRGDRDPHVADAVPVSRKVVATGACVAAVVALPYAHSSLEWLRVFDSAREAADDPVAAGGPLPTASVGEAKLPGATFDQQARAADLDAPAPDSRGPIAHAGKPDESPLPAVAEDKPPRSIEGAAALDKAFAKLAKVERRDAGAIARVLYFGDSIVASDFV